MSDSGLLSKPWPLTGRHEDLDEICAAVAEGCPAFFIVGEAGTGKTRLAREVLRQLAAEGWPTAGATATESAQSTPLAALAHLVPSAAIDAPPTLFAATRDALAERSGGRPLVLHVDDAHHLDPSSATLLVSLAEADAVRLVVTMRQGLRAPEAMVALRAADNARSVTLGALDPMAIDALLHRVLGGPIDGSAEAQLVDVSGGNPLYLRELVLGAVADGILREVAGVWRLEGRLPASEALGDRVLGRVATLGDRARDALELVALGEPIGLDLLETMVDPLVLEELEDRGLIRVEVDQRRHQVRLGHPVYGEILRSTLGRVRLRRLSRQLAEAVTGLGARRNEDAVRIVRWQIDAGIAPDPDVVLGGARLARHHHDWPSVISLSRAALEAGSADAAALAAEAHFELGEFDEVDALTAAALAPGARERLGEEPRTQLQRTHALSLMWAHDDSDAAVDVIEAALAEVVEPANREMLLFAKAGLLVWSARVAEASAVVDDILTSDAERVVVQAAIVAELVAAACGPTGRAIELADRWFPVHLGLPDLGGTNNPGNHIVTKAVALCHAGRLDEAGSLAELAYGASVANRSLIGQMWTALQLGRVALMRGDAVTARRWFREQVALCRGTGHRRPITLGLSGLAVAEAQLGDRDAAAAAVAEVDEHPSAVIELFAVEWARGRAWAAGDPATARTILLEAAEASEAHGIVLLAALARFDAVRLGAPGQAEPLAVAAETCESAIVALAARWAAEAGSGGAMEEVATGFEDLGCLMYAAEAFAVAASAWRRASEPRKAAAAEQRADELARRCRGGATPALTVVDSIVPLTAREREIALLVAEGLTTKDVAARLYLSARTVSNHLQNAYTKLGISKRSELAGALGRLGVEGATGDEEAER